LYTSAINGTPQQEELGIFGASRIGLNFKKDNQYVYELSDHLGNVRATFGEDASGDLQTYTYSDYFPFGMKIPGRLKTNEEYRFGYQGQFAEEDEETGYNAFEARLWDSRAARWMAPDPAGQYWSPYLGMGNSGINYIDKNGEIGEKFMARMYAFWGKMQGYTHTNYWKADNGEWLASKGGFAKNFGQNTGFSLFNLHQNITSLKYTELIFYESFVVGSNFFGKMTLEKYTGVTYGNGINNFTYKAMERSWSYSQDFNTGVLDITLDYNDSGIDFSFGNKGKVILGASKQGYKIGVSKTEDDVIQGINYIWKPSREFKTILQLAPFTNSKKAPRSLKKVHLNN
jgi:RHS repeat-associated protein